MLAQLIPRIVRSGAAATSACLPTVIWAQGPQRIPSTLAPASTSAHQIFDLSLFVVTLTGAIFVVVGGLLAIALFKFRVRKSDPSAEPAQIYGSTQIELAWTVIPVLIVVVLFLTTARIIFAIQDAPKPSAAVVLLSSVISSGGSLDTRNMVWLPPTNSISR